MPFRVALLAFTLAGVAWAGQAQGIFDECRRLIQDGLVEEEDAKCFSKVAEQQGAIELAIDQLEELRQVHSRSGWLPAVQAYLMWPQGVEQYEKAVQEFEEQGNSLDAIRMRVNLADLHTQHDRLEEARSQLDQAEKAAGEDDSLTRAIVLIGQARHYLHKGEDLEADYWRLREALRITRQLEDSPLSIRLECLRSLIRVALELGLGREAEDCAWEALQLAQDHDRLSDQAWARYELVRAIKSHLPPNDENRQIIRDHLEEALEAALESGNLESEALIRRLNAEMEDGPKAEEQLLRCRDLAVRSRDKELEMHCLLSHARHVSKKDLIQASNLLGEAFAKVENSESPWVLLYGWDDHLEALWRIVPRQEAVTTSESVLNAIEALRRLQIGTARSRLLSGWAGAYHWLAGRLLDSPFDRQGTRRAFSVMERLRAQALREAVELGRVELPPLPEDLDVQWQKLRQDLGQAYRQLITARPESDEYALALTQLSRLEQREAQLRSDSVGYQPDRPHLERLGPELLDRIEGALADDEALLSFQMAWWEDYDQRFAGGSWLLATTRGGTRSYPLSSDAAKLQAAFASYWDGEDREDPEVLSFFYRELLAPALQDLPDPVRRLILVPDGFLHMLPFAALRPDPHSPSLIESFDLATVPSAALWLHWKEGSGSQAEQASAAKAALVLGNPELPGQKAPQSLQSSTRTTIGNRLGPLPYAQREGEKVVSRLRGKSLLRFGRRASENFLKSANLRQFSVLHLAAHSRVDDQKPWRSAVLLAGDEPEDGLLRPPEIAAMKILAGKLVVLSSCSSASGEVLKGEGVVGLARAFFEAGAQAVVGSLWPLDDRQAMEFFDAFYARLSRGMSVGKALAEAQRQWIQESRPASAWAGVIVIGNSDLVPVPGGVPRSQFLPSAALLALLAAMLLFLLMRWRRFS